MAKKTLILTQKQLDEIVGGDMSYFDHDTHLGDNDVVDGNNEVYAGKHNSKPVPSDKISRRLTRQTGYGLGKKLPCAAVPYVVTCSKADWKERNLVNEENQDLVNRKFNNGKDSYTNTTTKIGRMEDALELAQKGIEGGAERFNDLGGEEEYRRLKTQYGAAKNASASRKESLSNMGIQAYQKPNGTKEYGNGKAHTPKNNQVITYENKITEAKSIKSKKLFDIVQQHGGFYKESYLMGRKTNHDIRMTNADLHSLTDDQVIDVVDYSQIKPTIENIRKNKLYGFVSGDDIDYVQLMDGKYLLLLVKNANQYKSREYQKGDFQDLVDKKIERDKNKPYKGKHNDNYQWKSTDAQHYVFNNPYYKDWDDEAKEQMKNKIKDDYKK